MMMMMIALCIHFVFSLYHHHHHHHHQQQQQQQQQQYRDHNHSILRWRSVQKEKGQSVVSPREGVPADGSKSSFVHFRHSRCPSVALRSAQVVLHAATCCKLCIDLSQSTASRTVSPLVCDSRLSSVFCCCLTAAKCLVFCRQLVSWLKFSSLKTFSL